MEGNATMRSQSYAVSIEHILRRVFECDRCGFGGIANSDYIRKHPCAAMFSCLAYLYANASSEKRVEIEKFIEDHLLYADMSIDFLLSFENASKTDGAMTIELDCENGEIALQKIISEFDQITK